MDFTDFMDPLDGMEICVLDYWRFDMPCAECKLAMGRFNGYDTAVLFKKTQ